ncbi:tetratricopeptide repeat protein [Oscillatoriales cyanobacterium LEGE 11467]|uniref:Tetratricopeptide repeat protein n=1 Tax=Zarconia navalis LEGE 11467 TaxID=1828826 RepID=A0A928ZAJ4_9CYAN|nr:tetratricopeptide repeat protein [Zarconia navalis]MBE9041756.1 tetratricopeptide repeat protein [Zarconia navalis LEGE 11467]
MATVSEALKLASQYHRANRCLQADRVYRKVLEISPNQPDALCGLGAIAGQSGEYDSAGRWLDAAIRAHPESVKAWFGLGNLHSIRGQFADAVAAYERVIVLAPNLVAAYNNLGYALQQQGEWERAIATYQKALELQPDCTEADVNLANALYAKGQLPPDRQQGYGVANAELGQACQKAGDVTTAIAYYRQAIAMHPELAGVHHNLAAALQERGLFEEALASYQTALELNPENTELADFLTIYQSLL